MNCHIVKAVDLMTASCTSVMGLSDNLIKCQHAFCTVVQGLRVLHITDVWIEVHH